MKNFDELGLSATMLKAVDALGFTTPTPIQEKTIPAILNGSYDIIAIAQTGTGKTAGFGFPVIQQISPEEQTVQAIILSPTRELCIQITKDLINFSKFSTHVTVLAVYGGASIETQVKSLKKGVQIVVGTPGRTLDLIKRKALKINNIRWLILDEADEMLNMGFREDLDSILETTPKTKQTLLFSATIPDGVRQIAKNYMHKPVDISAGKINIGAENVLHHYYLVKPHERYMALKRVADIYPNIYSIIFCRTRSETKDLAEKLINDGYNADALHGDLSQSQRDLVMQRFRTRQIQLLVATDVAARGLDINDLTHVLNYTLPDDPEIYLHRSGRTGRAGKTGISIVITYSREERKIRELEKIVGKKFEQKLIPTGIEICKKRLYSLMDKIESIEVDYAQIEPFMDTINQKLSWLDREELLKRFVYVEFEKFLNYYKNSGDINVRSDENKKPDRKEKKKHDGDFSRFFINVGSSQKIRVTDIIGLINDYTKRRDIEVGKVDIYGKFSFFEIDKKYEQLILESFKDSQFQDKKLFVEISKPSQGKKEDEFVKRKDFRKKDFGKKDFGKKDFGKKDFGKERKQRGEKRKRY